MIADSAVSRATSREIGAVAAASRDVLPPTIASDDLPRVRRNLLDWYAAAKRDLDWRRTRDPYRIWLSEIMLQQTRVTAVIPYYRKFVTRFPTLRHLARARIDSVLRYWAGLGYYSRARHLHRAAMRIVEHHGGEFPRDLVDALALPGIGSYTAAAVLSIAYDAPLAVVDGNVARVLARLGAIRADLRQPSVWRQLTRTAGMLLDASAPGNWNQAMMELGATVCTPRAPRCSECPVSQWCRARALGIAGEIPAAQRKRSTVRLILAAAVLLDPQGRTLLVRYQERGRAVRPYADDPSRDGADAGAALFSRLWQFPSVVQTIPEPGPRNGATKAGAREKFQPSQGRQLAPALPRGNGLARKLSAHLKLTFGIGSLNLEPLATSRHAVTYRDILLAPFLARVERLPEAADARTPRIAQIACLPISSATRKVATAVLPVLQKPPLARRKLAVSRTPRSARTKSV